MNMAWGKIRLRQWDERDFATDIKWAKDPEVIAYDPSVGLILNIQKFSIDTLDGRYIGFCSLYNQTLTDVQMGIRIGDKNYWDKGYGTDAVNALVAQCFSTRSVDLIWLKVLPENTRAIRCYEKCGFGHTGRFTLGGYEFIRMEKRRQQ